MKKFFICLVCLLTVASFMLPAFAEDAAFEPITLNFDALPEGMSESDNVSIAGNGVMQFTYPTDKESSTAGMAKDRAFIPLCEDFINTDCTVSLYVLTDYPSNWCQQLTIGLSDDIGNDKVVAGFLTNNGNKVFGEKVLLYYSSTADNGFVISDKVLVENVWTRIDMVLDFVNSSVDYYMDYEKIGTGTIPNGTFGFTGIWSRQQNSANQGATRYIDEVVVRDGLHVPSKTDCVATVDRTAIESDPDMLIYQPFDMMPDGARSNAPADRLQIAVVPHDGPVTQSCLSVVATKGDTALDTYIPFSNTALTGNATVSVRFMAKCTSKSMPGISMKLVDADRKVLGGMVITASSEFCFDDGEHLIKLTNEEDEVLTVDPTVWNRMDMLVNYENRSLTVYLNGERIGTAALEGDINSFTGLLLEKSSTDATEDEEFRFDDISVVSGLYAPQSTEALAPDSDVLKIDVTYSEPIEKPDDPDDTDNSDKDETEAPGKSENDNPAQTKSGNTNEDTSKETEPVKEKGCKSMALANVCALMVLGLSAVVVLRKKKI